MQMRTSIHIQNLRCGGCVNTITKAISKVKDVSEVSVDIAAATVSFVYHEFTAALEVKSVLERLGYPSIAAKNSLKSKMSSLVSCAVGKVSKKDAL